MSPLLNIARAFAHIVGHHKNNSADLDDDTGAAFVRRSLQNAIE